MNEWRVYVVYVLYAERPNIVIIMMNGCKDGMIFDAFVLCALAVAFCSLLYNCTEAVHCGFAEYCCFMALTDDVGVSATATNAMILQL